ncbi:MAG: acyltransferase family protein [Clostridia bacterium]|nr:acyltransferase family protein [Clostridia bacterium]
MEVSLKRQTEYESWVDVAKGIAVFLVCLGHFWYRSDIALLNQMIYSFHVPLWFILSGYLAKRDEKFLPHIWNKFIRLIVPCYVYITLTGILYFQDLPTETAINNILSDWFYFKGKIAFNAPCWYFIVLFEAFVFEALLKIKSNNILYKSIALLFFFVLGLIVYINKVQVPFGLDRAIISMQFFVIGMIIKDISKPIASKMAKMDQWLVYTYSLVFIILCGAIWWHLGVNKQPKVSLYSMNIGNYYYFILSGLFGSFAMLTFVYLIAKNRYKHLCKIGKNSMLIIGTHYFIRWLYYKALEEYGIFYTWRYSLLTVMFVVIMIEAYLPICVWVDKKMPVIVGKPLFRSNKLLYLAQ